MPLFKIQKIHPHSTLAIWHITEELPELLSKVNLDLEDKAEFYSIHNEVKQAEWMAAKILLSMLLAREGEKYNGIYKNEAGKPFLHGFPYHISITHSKKYVACILNKKDEVGIDMEPVKEKIYNVRSKFLCEEELEFTSDNLEMLTIYWCCKEALYKLNGKKGVIFSRHIKVRADPNSSEAMGIVHTEEYLRNIQLQIQEWDGYILAYSL